MQPYLHLALHYCKYWTGLLKLLKSSEFTFKPNTLTALVGAAAEETNLSQYRLEEGTQHSADSGQVGLEACCWEKVYESMNESSG